MERKSCTSEKERGKGPRRRRGGAFVIRHKRKVQTPVEQEREGMTDSCRRTISDLAARFGLSRSTLLYYDARGLLSPCDRTPAGYRLYDEECAARLERICTLREAGMLLDQVKRLLDAPFSSPLRRLEECLAALAEEIRHLRRQQRLVLRLLETEGAVETPVFPNKESWSTMLREAGLDESGLHALHVLFEEKAPEAHRDFLESSEWMRRRSKGYGRPQRRSKKPGSRNEGGSAASGPPSSRFPGVFIGT